MLNFVNLTVTKMTGKDSAKRFSIWLSVRFIFKKLGQLQEKISKASLPVSADLSNDFKSIILETDQRKIYPS